MGGVDCDDARAGGVKRTGVGDSVISALRIDGLVYRADEGWDIIASERHILAVGALRQGVQGLAAGLTVLNLEGIHRNVLGLGFAGPLLRRLHGHCIHRVFDAACEEDHGHRVDSGRVHQLGGFGQGIAHALQAARRGIARALKRVRGHPIQKLILALGGGQTNFSAVTVDVLAHRHLHGVAAIHEVTAVNQRAEHLPHVV